MKDRSYILPVVISVVAMLFMFAGPIWAGGAGTHTRSGPSMVVPQQKKAIEIPLRLLEGNGPDASNCVGFSQYCCTCSGTRVCITGAPANCTVQCDSVGHPGVYINCSSCPPKYAACPIIQQ